MSGYQSAELSRNVADAVVWWEVLFVIGLNTDSQAVVFAAGIHEPTLDRGPMPLYIPILMMGGLLLVWCGFGQMAFRLIVKARRSRLNIH
jgi:hypothetical protein